MKNETSGNIYEQAKGTRCVWNRKSPATSVCFVVLFDQNKLSSSDGAPSRKRARATATIGLLSFQLFNILLLRHTPDRLLRHADHEALPCQSRKDGSCLAAPLLLALGGSVDRCHFELTPDLLLEEK